MIANIKESESESELNDSESENSNPHFLAAVDMINSLNELVGNGNLNRNLAWYMCPKRHVIECRGAYGHGPARDIYCIICDHIYVKTQCQRCNVIIPYPNKASMSEETKRKRSEAARKRALGIWEAKKKAQSNTLFVRRGSL